MKSRPKPIIQEPVVQRRPERAATPDIFENVTYKTNNQEKRQRYANMAYYIDQEEKKRVLSEDMEELERIEKAEKFLRNRD